MKLACEWAEKGGGRDPVSVSDRVVGDSRWAVYAGVRQAISTIGEAARLPRLEDALQRLALQSFIAQRGSPAISLAALEILSAKVAAHDFGGIEAAIEASFVETTRRFPARREAAQLPVVAPTPVVEAGRHAEALRAFIDRIAARIISGGSEAPSAADQLAATILQRIQFGGLRPGEAIRELPIAKEFNTSRGPVRDALRTLDRRGIISIEGRKGAFVRELGESDIVGLFAIRAALSGVQMAEAAAAPERPEWIDDELRAGAGLLHLLAHDPESPFENYIVARRALALVTLAAGGNIVVGRLAAELEGEVSILWATVVSKQRQVESANTWEKIVAAIIAGDRRTAELEGRRIVTEAATEALRCSV
ncbi:GntR family transcriptional regulator [Sphingopyxis sp.]|uniref:GntR family transcriptional regulator n=1 Tax=Sphingopyxis sp. TaxID=1908224 RepID=UPI0035AE3B7B